MSTHEELLAQILKPTPEENKAEYLHNVRIRRIEKQTELAHQIAPAFRDKYDFSSPDDFKNWAALCFKAADALITKGSELMAEESARYQKEQEEAAKKEAAK